VAGRWTTVHSPDVAVQEGPQLLPRCTRTGCYGDGLDNVPLLPERAGGDRTTACVGHRRSGRAVKVELW